MSVTRLAACLLGGSLLAIAADWPQWRGVERDGVSKEAGLLQEWPEGGPPLAWKATGLGEGFASVAVSGGRIITQGQSRGGQSVVALDEATGRVLWRTPNGDAYLDRRGGGPRGTPTIDGETVYTLGSNGSLIALEAATGKRLWATNLLRRFNARNINWGISESPLIDGRKVVVNAGGGGASIVAIDKSNGNVIWKSLDDEAGYSSAIVIEAGGVRQYVLLTGEAAVGVRADNGHQLWRYGRVSNRTANVATPIARSGRVFVSSDYGTGGGLLELATNGSGVDAKEVYFTREMRNHYNTPVLVGDHLYGYSSRILTCMNFETGEVAWKDRSVGKGQVIAAEGLLYLLSEDGVAGLAEATPEGYRERSRFSIPRGRYPTWALPVVANGRLYLREQDTLYAYDISSE
ncbi:MAG: PQQ-like beta-propeller repeat protein [Bryobacterales bacterium]|nr:PQQ-like beta-propeller repeat protein [Bryobacterales bacterium]MDE0295069.1 PQQ-like beta-propeller repeat protein [Bryobacterales bacterium]